jgi:hypothetical protein
MKTLDFGNVAVDRVQDWHGAFYLGLAMLTAAQVMSNSARWWLKI